MHISQDLAVTAGFFGIGTLKLIPLPSTTLILSVVLTYSGSWWTVHQYGVGWAGLPGEVTHHPAGSLKH
ncbi:hypothetical protein, partial [Pseudovibrio sp. W64]|uniref:hypothetical protein n=1 Tax=Pseudovibrio sp. W64 TaxID=1735583 RepID=UPI0019D3BAA8